MIIQQQLPQLESLCAQLYNSQNPQERALAEQSLKVFGESTEYIPHCKSILDNSSSPYAQLLATSSLLRLVTEQALSVQTRLEMRQYFLGWLESRGPRVEPFVLVSLLQLLARVSKLSWWEGEAFRGTPADAERLLEAAQAASSPQGYEAGLRMLAALVAEMNAASGGLSVAQHRKIAVSFRDLSLGSIFQLSLRAMHSLQRSGAQGEERLQEQAASLSLACLSFDFVGSGMDESSEDVGTIQVPASWRPAIEDPATLALFFEGYRASASPALSSKCLECLARLAAVRRSLFGSEQTRGAYLSQLVRGTLGVLAARDALQEHANFHELCRLLSRIKINYQLAELVALPEYGRWVEAVVSLTLDALRAWAWAGPSLSYLLGLWARLVASVPYLKGDAPSQLDRHVPSILRAYLASRLDAAAALARQEAAAGESAAAPPEEEEEGLDALPPLFRFRYAETAARLGRALDALSAAYASWDGRSGGGAAFDAAAPGAGSQGPDQDADSLPLLGAGPPRTLGELESQLACLLRVVAAVVLGRGAGSAAEAVDALDGDLCARVLALLPIADSAAGAARGGEASRVRLDLAFLSFFHAFRKVFVGEQALLSSKIYVRLGERVGLDGHGALVDALLRKIAGNLRAHARQPRVVDESLALLADLAGGYMSGKLLQQAEGVAFMLAHHTPQDFAFLAHPANARARTAFHATLARLLFADESAPRFRAFVAPLDAQLRYLAQAAGLEIGPVALPIDPAATEAFGPPALRALRASADDDSVGGLFRDLRGVVSAAHNRRAYALVFDWLYPSWTRLGRACLVAWADVPRVTTPVLKFFAEFAFNRAQRLAFEASSPSGILLFREVAAVLAAHAPAALAPLAPGADVYAARYRGLAACLSALHRALTGGYANLGVFALYGDASLRDALDLALRLVCAVPLADLVAYRKLSRAVFALADALCAAHLHALADGGVAATASLLTALDAGVKSLDVSISSQCAAAVDSLATYLFRHRRDGAEPTATAQTLAEHVRQQSSMLPNLLQTLFETVFLEDCSNQWSLSRPMLSLMLLDPAGLAAVQRKIVAAQPAERHARLAACFEKLMQGVEPALESKNRDKFTQNLTVVRQEFRSKT